MIIRAATTVSVPMTLITVEIMKEIININTEANNAIITWTSTRVSA